MQRFFDIIFSSIALVVFLPLFILIAITLKFTGEGEIFFLQERVGQNKQLFKLFKFATMLKNSPNLGAGTVTLKNDPRVLPFGRFIRQTKINELPQLINIFLGDMSIVGPRPQAQRCFDAFPLKYQVIITQIKPGLSGIGSIIFRDEENILADHARSIHFYDQVVAPYKGKVEAWYISHQKMRYYFLIILLTIWVVIKPKSNLIWKIFYDLPVPPGELKLALNYKKP
jgi:lipopolysaccharide/colanic/teichoic acid biosynthesis glycosyltransferase